MSGRVAIFSGPIRSGKTTRLLRWVAGRDADGVLAPDIDGLRCIHHVATGTRFPLEIAPGESAARTVTVGRFRFHAAAFERCRRMLETARENEPRWLVVDEAGKLELAGDGLEPAVGDLLAAYRDRPGRGTLVLVVRDVLLEEAIRHFGLESARVVHDPDELESE